MSKPNQVATVWRLLTLLVDCRVRTEHLAADLGVTVRTVNRMLVQVAEAGLPLEVHVESRMAWYHLPPNAVSQALKGRDEHAVFWMADKKNESGVWEIIYHGRSEVIARAFAKEAWISMGGPMNQSNQVVRIFSSTATTNPKPEPLNF